MRIETIIMPRRAEWPRYPEAGAILAIVLLAYLNAAALLVFG